MFLYSRSRQKYFKVHQIESSPDWFQGFFQTKQEVDRSIAAMDAEGGRSHSPSQSLSPGRKRKLSGEPEDFRKPKEGRRARGDKPHIKFSRTTTWARCWHAGFGHHYFIHPDTGQSVWSIPDGDTFEDAPVLPTETAGENAATAATEHQSEAKLEDEALIKETASNPRPPHSVSVSADEASSARAAGPASVQTPLGPDVIQSSDAVGAQRLAVGGALDSAGSLGGGGKAGASGGGRSGEEATNIVCLLCQRKFKSAEQLSKHCAMSDLHRQNVAKAKVNV